jgi:hypothetical protein
MPSRTNYERDLIGGLRPARLGALVLTSQPGRFHANLLKAAPRSLQH